MFKIKRRVRQSGRMPHFRGAEGVCEERARQSGRMPHFRGAGGVCEERARQSGRMPHFRGAGGVCKERAQAFRYPMTLIAVSWIRTAYLSIGSPSR